MTSAAVGKKCKWFSFLDKDKINIYILIDALEDHHVCTVGPSCDQI